VPPRGRIDVRPAGTRKRRGRSDVLKEVLIGMELFDRRLDDYEPRTIRSPGIQDRVCPDLDPDQGIGASTRCVRGLRWVCGRRTLTNSAALTMISMTASQPLLLRRPNSPFGIVRSATMRHTTINPLESSWFAPPNSCASTFDC